MRQHQLRVVLLAGASRHASGGVFFTPMVCGWLSQIRALFTETSTCHCSCGKFAHNKKDAAWLFCRGGRRDGSIFSICRAGITIPPPSPSQKRSQKDGSGNSVLGM
nr:hypothetical protein CFP56_13144 [Quercus suber]